MNEKQRFHFFVKKINNTVKKTQTKWYMIHKIKNEHIFNRKDVNLKFSSLIPWSHKK